MTGPNSKAILDRSPVIIRHLVESDLETLSRMMNDFNREDELDSPLFTVEQLREDGFGPRKAYDCLIAVSSQEPKACLGYLLYLPAYESTMGGRSIHMQDLYVVPEARSQGVGRKLMARLARIAKDEKAACVEWGVFDSNERGQDFYRSIGAEDVKARVYGLDPAAIGRLAEEDS